MRPEPGQVLHFSEDPTITRFEPHIARTATDQTAYVWAVDDQRAPDYWFPRQCPRAGLVHEEDNRSRSAAGARIGPTAARVHVTEYAWLERMQHARLFAYRFDAANFEPYGHPDDPHTMVSRVPVSALGPPRPVGDLIQLHQQACIKLRLVDRLRPWWNAVITTSVGYSGIHLANASP